MLRLACAGEAPPVYAWHPCKVKDSDLIPAHQPAAHLVIDELATPIHRHSIIQLENHGVVNESLGDSHVKIMFRGRFVGPGRRSGCEPAARDSFIRGNEPTVGTAPHAGVVRLRKTSSAAGRTPLIVGPPCLAAGRCGCRRKLVGSGPHPSKSKFETAQGKLGGPQLNWRSLPSLPNQRVPRAQDRHC